MRETLKALVDQCGYEAVARELKVIKNELNYSARYAKTIELRRKVGELKAQGKSHAEIATVLGIPKSTVKEYVKRNASTLLPVVED